MDSILQVGFTSQILRDRLKSMMECVIQLVLIPKLLCDLVKTIMNDIIKI